ncbi:MAG TPA: hypothetical protein VLE49_19295 [Anaerolineales bacterium]|nr:hypothetical protein [Anaerolineales bacterium]
MTQDRKYFGMTPTQIGILAGLAGAACLLFAVAGFLILRGGLGGSAPAPQETPTPQFTVTPFVLPSVAPTETLTPVPYEMLIPDGWLQFKTGLVEIWLPKEFKAAKTKTADNSANWAVSEMVATAPGTTSKSSVYKMFVVVSYEPLTGDSLDAYLNGKIASLSSSTRIADKRTVTLNAQDAVRFVLEKRTDTAEVNDMVYVFLDGTTVWYVEYIAQINEYFTMIDTFEKSARTFRIVR